jgi:uncharacterized membrane protein YozB (DUF420 family)
MNLAMENHSRKRDIFILTGLIVLSLTPAAAGIFRVVTLAAGTTVDAENARFHAAPIPVAIHILCSLFYCILGAFQFAPGFRTQHRSWHRKSGKWIASTGLIAALSGFWLTLFYPAASNDGPGLYYVRLVIAPGMFLCLCLGIRSVMRGNLQSHGAWMMRAYALGMGAGTQVITHFAWAIPLSPPTGVARDAMMTLAWVINLAIAEWLIFRKSQQRLAPA